MNNFPTTTEESIQSLLAKGANRNWIESLAYESGIDFDHKMDGSDDEFNKFTS